MDEPVDVTYHRRVLEQRPAPDWPALTQHPRWGPLASLLALAAHLEHAPEPGHRLDRAEMAAGLALGDAAEEALSRATYIIGAHARACGWTWPEITRAQNLDSHKGVMRRYGRLAERHPDYTPPLAHTLEAHRVRAAELLLATDREMSPNARRTAADRLGAVLLAATLTRAPSTLVATWLDQDDHTLNGALVALGTLPGTEPDRARQVLRTHAMDGPGTRADLLTYMREALRESPRALPGAPAPAPALETAGPGSVAGENEPLHTLEELRERARTWLRALPEPVEEADERAATRLLGAALFAALSFLPTWDRALAHVPTWLDDDTLTGPRAVLEADLSPRTSPAREILTVHARTDAPTRARIVALIRAALGGPDGPGEGVATEGDASGSFPTATASVEPGPGPDPDRRPGYARPLERAGLSPAAADALADPLTRFVGEATLVSHREVHLQTRQVMQALQPTLLSQRPARVRTLLYLLPRLDLYGLGGWAPLALAISEHAPELERLPSAADLLGAADLPAPLAQDVDALVNGARRVLVASWAPTAPVWEAGPALERLTAAVEGGEIDHLAAALEAVAELDQTLLGQDSAFGSHQLHYQWENLAHAWRQARPAIPAAPGWSLLAAKMFPNAAMAEAVAHLLETTGPLLDTATLGEGQTHQALSTLRRAVLHGRTASLGTVLDDVLNLKPSGHPVKDHPQVAHALTTLINAYDHQ